MGPLGTGPATGQTDRKWCHNNATTVVVPQRTSEMENYSSGEMQERHLTHWQMSVVNLALWRASHQGWNHGNTSWVQAARDERNRYKLSWMKEIKETDQLKWICTSAGWSSTLKTMYAEWTHYKHTHTHFVCSLLLRHLKQRQTLVGESGTQHFSSEVSKRQRAQELLEDTEMYPRP